MNISINTPALLFPAISLIMLAYTNRFLAIASRVRSLHERYKDYEDKKVIHGQISNMRYRLRLIKYMQGLGVFAFLSCILCMYLIYIEQMGWAHCMFASGLITFSLSLCISLREIQLSTKALELEISDIENLEDPSVLGYIRSKFERD